MKEPSMRLMLLSLLALSLSACDGEAYTYILDLRVKGSPTAVAGRTIKAGKRDMLAFQVINGEGSTFVELCTPSEQKFRHGSVPLEVWSNSALVSTASVSVTACAFAKPPGPRELANIYLDEDGMLLTDPTAGDLRVTASCSDLPGGSICSHGDDF
jgi:hypothetical protein